VKRQRLRWTVEAGNGRHDEDPHDMMGKGFLWQGIGWILHWKGLVVLTWDGSRRRRTVCVRRATKETETKETEAKKERSCESQ